MFFVVSLTLAVLVYVLAHALTNAFGLPAFFGHWAWWLCVFLLVTAAYVERVRDELAIQSKNMMWTAPALRPLIFGGFFGFLGRFNFSLTILTLIASWIAFNWIAMLAAFGVHVLFSLALSRVATRHAKQVLIEPQVVGNEALQEFLGTEQVSEQRAANRVQSGDENVHGETIASEPRKATPAAMKRWLIIFAVALSFVAFLWPTPALEAKGGASIFIGAFWPTIFYADEGLPATPLAEGWMLPGLAVGAGIGYRLQRRKGAKR